MTAPEKSFIERVARIIARPGPNAPRNVTGSILAQAARLHGMRPSGDESTAPTGFDPVATALFQNTLEAAYLVAASDGPIDETEAALLRAIIGVGSDNKIGPAEAEEMIDDMRMQHAREGEEARARSIGRMVHNRDHQHEVLRIATIVARASGAVAPRPRAMLDKLAQAFSLAPSVVDTAIAEVEESLSRA